MDTAVERARRMAGFPHPYPEPVDTRPGVAATLIPANAALDFGDFGDFRDVASREPHGMMVRD